jgi:hypothetical protein
MKTINCFSLFLLIFFASCKDKSNPTVVAQDYSNMTQSWSNSFEEQIDSIQVYRPSNYKQYPAARFREIFEFSKDRSCNYLVLSPVDAHYMQSGKWSIISPDNKVIGIFDSLQTIYRRFQLVELKQDLLKFVYVN